jgi:hypothetical protein
MYAILGDCGRSPNDSEDPDEDSDEPQEYSFTREEHEAILDYYGVHTIADLPSWILPGYGG